MQSPKVAGYVASLQLRGHLDPRRKSTHASFCVFSAPAAWGQGQWFSILAAHRCHEGTSFTVLVPQPKLIKAESVMRPGHCNSLEAAQWIVMGMQSWDGELTTCSTGKEGSMVSEPSNSHNDWFKNRPVTWPSAQRRNLKLVPGMMGQRCCPCYRTGMRKHITWWQVFLESWEFT